MTRFVVDASVAVKWVVPEVHSDSAVRLLEDGFSLAAPELIWAELGSVLWKKWRREEIPRERVPVFLQALQSFQIHTTSSESLLDLAWEIARDHRRSFYDSLYLALALQLQCLLVTADSRFYNAISKADSQMPILWVEDVPLGGPHPGRSW